MHKIVTNTPLQKSTKELADLQNVTSTFLTSINSSFVEFFPQVAYLPKIFQTWRPHWERMGTYHYHVFKHWWEGWKHLASPIAEPSLLRDEILQNLSGSEDDAIYITILAIVAGADNPRMTMNAWFMACLAYPDAMNKARAEIDGLCGTERLPTLDDFYSLPYVCAMVKEVLRWRPTVPLVPQRVLVEDMDFEGYMFPKGTEFLVNSIPVCTDGLQYPKEFRPERWLDGPGMSAFGQELWQFAFSAGRRSCLGYKLAQRELFIAFAKILFCFDISSNGDFDDTKLNAFSPGEPFPVRLRVRSPAHEQLILETGPESGETWGS